MSLMVFIENFTTSAQSSITAYDWWKDIIIPLIGAIAVPLLIWGLTWYYGAEKAEERKEKRDLRDNLNLLLSFCFDCLVKLEALRRKLIELKEIINTEKNINPFSKQATLLTQIFTSPTNTKVINIENYSPCISHSKDYVISLLKIISALEIKDFKLERRNFYAKEIDNQDTLEKKINCLNQLIKYDLQESESFIVYLNGLILMIKEFINQTINLKTKIKGLKLNTIEFSKEQLELFAEIENLNTKPKEQENDK